METENIVTEMKKCAGLLYQNKEIEAYQQLEQLVPKINEALQVMTNLLEQNQEMKKEVLLSVQSFMEAYQKQDILALADVLYYQLSEQIKMVQNI